MIVNEPRVHRAGGEICVALALLLLVMPVLSHLLRLVRGAHG